MGGTIEGNKDLADHELGPEEYRFLVNYYLHQDKLSWSRTQAVVAIEAGLLAAAFAKRGGLAVLALLLGSIVIGLIWLVMERDWQIRDQHLPLLDAFHERTGIKMATPASAWWQSGTSLTRILLTLIIGMNTVAAVCFALGDYLATFAN